jgi:hypothetical protein
MATSHDAAALTVRIEHHIQRLEAQGDSPAKAEAQSLVRLLLSLYGTGLSRMLDIVRTERGGPEAVLDRFAADPLVASLLVLHELHPDPVELRVGRCLTALQPHLPPETTLRAVGFESDAVSIQVEHRGGAVAAASGLREAIERAIQEAAPEIATIRIEGLADAPVPLIQIIRRPAPAPVRAER